MTEISELEHRLADALGRMRIAHHTTKKTLSYALNRVETLESELEQARVAVPVPDVGPEPVAAPDMSAQTDALHAEIAALAEQANVAKAESARLQQELADERLQLGQLVRKVEDDHQALGAAKAELAALKSTDRLETVKSSGQAEELQNRVGMMETVISQLQMAHAQLRQNNELLRAAHLAGGADEALLNASLTAEVASLKAARGADRAEIDSVLAALQPLIEETADA